MGTKLGADAQAQIDAASADNTKLTSIAAEKVQNGASVETGQQIRALSGWDAYHFEKGRLMALGERSGPMMDDYIRQSGLPLNNDADIAAAMAMARTKFMSVAGFNDKGERYKDELMYEALHPGLRKAESSLHKEYTTGSNINRSNDLQTQWKTDLINGAINGNDFFKKVQTTVDENGRPIYGAQASKLMWDTVEDARVNGVMDDAAYEKFLGTTPEQFGGKTYRDIYASKVKQIELAKMSKENAASNLNQAVRENQARQMQQDLIAALPKNYTDADVDAALAAYMDPNKGGYPDISPTQLQAIKANGTIDARLLQKQKGSIEDLVNKGLLTTERLQKFHPKLWAEFQNTAIMQGKVFGDASGYKVQLKSIENEVKVGVTAAPDGARSGTVPLMQAQLETEFLKEVAALTAAKDPNPANNALAIVLNRFKQGSTNPSSLYFKGADGYQNILPKSATLKASVLNTKAALARGNSVVKAVGNTAPDVAGALISKPELEANGKNFGTAQWRPTPMAVYWARHFNVDPLTIENRQRKAAGLGALSEPKSLQTVRSEVNPAYQQFLNRYQSPSRTTRALSTMKRFAPELIPNGYGQAVEQAARAYGIDPWILAGVIETESQWDAKAYNRDSGATGIAQIVPKWHPDAQPNDPVASIKYAAFYLSSLRKQFGGSINKAILAYNAGPNALLSNGGNALPGENADYLKKVIAATGKYGNPSAWRDPSTMRGSISSNFQIIEQVSGERGHQSYAGDHAGDNYHNHYAFGTRQERDRAIALLKQNGIKIGSTDRSGDPGYHGKGLAIDIPGDQVPPGQEEALSRRVRQILGVS
jgi:hypothetical protein